MYKYISANLANNISQIENEELKKFISDTTHGIIPKTMPDCIDDVLKHYRYSFLKDHSDYMELYSEILFAREIYTKFCSWSIITDDWISEITNLLYGKKCIEIMAGNGLLSHALQLHGIDITPYDNFSWIYDNTYTKVYDMDAVKCADALDYDYIICSWPPYQDSAIATVVKKMYYKHPNTKMIYIGENQGGCTACDKFFDITTKIVDGREADIIDNANDMFRSFIGINDHIQLLIPNDKARKYIQRMDRYANKEIY